MEQRVEVKRITAQWVKENVRLARRDEEILKFVYDHKLATTQQIADMFFRTKHGRNHCNQRLLKLYRMHVLDRRRPAATIGEGTKPWHWFLDRAGAIYLDLPGFKRRKALPQNYKHIVAVTQVYINTLVWCERHGWQIRVWEVEHPREFAWLGTKTLIPDVLALLSGPQNRGKAVFVEVDMGTEPVETLLAKIKTYRDYQMSGAWAYEPWAKAAVKPCFPKVVILMPHTNPRRMALVSKAIPPGFELRQSLDFCDPPE